jgi:hypothetical protein
MDLSPYTARGFPGDSDRAIAQVPVAGLDRVQAQSMVRVCPETEAVLYGPDFSPRAVRYRPGSRPQLEAIAKALLPGAGEDYAFAAAEWVRRHVRHPHLVGLTPPDRGLTEEGLVDSGVGWCNEQSRVFIALCELHDIPARLCFLFHRNQRCGHTATEVYLRDKWSFVDVTFCTWVCLPDGSLATGLELSREYRDLAHAAYRRPFREYLAGVRPEFDHVPGWGLKDRPDPDRAGDLLEVLGICNYVIEGAAG